MQALHIYLDRKIASIFLLGIISGTPWVMIGSALTLWLTEAGISRSVIGFSGLIFFVYAINFFWAPLIDRIKPKLGIKINAKLSWIVVCQGIIALSCIAMSQFAPASETKLLIFCALVLATASATQDIAIDAYRVQSFTTTQSKKVSAAAAAATGGWWTGYACIGFLPLMLSDQGISWPMLYQGMAAFTAACLLLCLCLPENTLNQTYVPNAATSHSHINTNSLLDNSVHQSKLSSSDTIKPASIKVPLTHSTIDKYRLIAMLVSPWLIAIWAVGQWHLPPNLIEQSYFPVLAMTVVFVLFAGTLVMLSRRPINTAPVTSHMSDRLLANIYQTLIAPLQDFFVRNGLHLAVCLLGFVFLFKVGEAFLGRMSIVFYKEIGFSKTEIALYSKTVTWVITLVSVVPAGILNARLGLYRGLMISGILMALSNLLFCAIALSGPVQWLYGLTVIVDGFTAAWGTVAFVAFISHLCNHQFSATQYALLASLGNLARTTLSSNSGLLVDALNGNWALFFLLTTLMIIPSLLLLRALRHKLSTL